MSTVPYVDEETIGFMKLLVKEDTDQIIGADMLATHAGDMISEISVAMDSEKGLMALAKAIHPFPTQAQIIRTAAETLLKKREHLVGSRREPLQIKERLPALCNLRNIFSSIQRETTNGKFKLGQNGIDLFSNHLAECSKSDNLRLVHVPEKLIPAKRLLEQKPPEALAFKRQASETSSIPRSTRLF